MNKISDANIVVVGGGTGLSTLLRGLKQHTKNITAIVTVADDGGGSGILRDDLGMLPPGDIRNCLLALAETEPTMENLLNYRFSEGTLSGQSVGNILLAAMQKIYGNFEEAIRRVSDVLKVKGKVLPVTLDNIHINAVLCDGTVIKGEHNISTGLKTGLQRIKRINLVPENATVLPDAIRAISKADIVVLGPGSIYTSIIPNLLVNGVADAIKNASAKVVYVCNLMSQPGESDEMTAYEHIKAIIDHSSEGIVDYCIVNVEPIPFCMAENYNQESATAVIVDEERFENTGIELIKGNFVSVKDNRYIRHNYDNLARTILDII